MNTACRSLPRFVCDPYRTEAEIIDTLFAVTATCGRIVPEREIREAVRNSKACAWTPGQQTPIRKTPPWPPVNRELLKSIVSDGIALVDLWEESLRRFDNNKPDTEEIIDALFPGNPFLCCAESTIKFAVRSREDWRGKLSGLQFIVPSPMLGETGLTQDGRESDHTLSGTGPRRFLVVECDYAEKCRDGT